jgi:dTDP-4-dehydrorhamnose 3,5-epimerase
MKGVVQIEPLSIAGSYVITPQVFGDARGLFFEWFRAEAFAEAVGYGLQVAQANCSVSAAGTVRGIHYADVPPGQGKYVMCVAGSVRDVVVDIRVGSPTFGQWESVVLEPGLPRMVYLSEGLGHGFVALEEGSTVIYLCSSPYDPAAEHEVDPFDARLGIEWGLSREQARLSAKDAAAPGLEEAQRRGLLPDFAVCQRWQAGQG